jgi:hypothetical protein
MLRKRFDLVSWFGRTIVFSSRGQEWFVTSRFEDRDHPRKAWLPQDVIGCVETIKPEIRSVFFAIV